MCGIRGAGWAHACSATSSSSSSSSSAVYSFVKLARMCRMRNVICFTFVRGKKSNVCAVSHCDLIAPSSCFIAIFVFRRVLFDSCDSRSWNFL